MTTHVQARHRALARPLTPFTGLGDQLARRAHGAGRTSAVAVAAGGLLFSIALPAGAAPQAAPAEVAGAVPAAVDSAFGATPVGVVSAATTVTATPTTLSTFAEVPTPAPVVIAPVVVAAARTASAAPAVATAVDQYPAVTVPVVASAPAEVAAPAAPAAPAPAPLGQQILDVADDYAGVPYVYGGTTPSGFDCSGYTGWVYRELGIQLPRIANDQYRSSARISAAQAVPGDLVFMLNGSGRAYHVGIYAGGGQMWDAPRTGKPVQLRAIWDKSAQFGRVANV